MKHSLAIIFLASFLALNAADPVGTIHTGKSKIDYTIDGETFSNQWHVSPELRPDILTTTGSVVSFATESDTITLKLDVWQQKDFCIITQKGDSAFVRVARTAVNPFDNPNPEIRKISPSGLLSREQARFDINALIYTLGQVHPDIFSVCSQTDFFRAVNRSLDLLPDSVSLPELYKAAAPLVAMIGDGHTNLSFPYKKFRSGGRKCMPVCCEVLNDRSIICYAEPDSVIPPGSIIMRINGMDADSIVRSMIPFVSGEREHFRLARVNTMFNYLFELMYPAGSYSVEYLPVNSSETQTAVLSPVSFSGFRKYFSKKKKSNNDPYSYIIDKKTGTAIMDFQSFEDPDRMRHFADSMFADIKKNKINNLIIDVRNNGGGISTVGDILLKYITDKPFIQMDRGLVKITPKTIELMGVNGDIAPGYYFFEPDSKDYVKPLKPEEGHFDGNVFLLTSNKTFSSAASFSWAFKECGMGTVVGEETGGMNVCYGDILIYRLPVSGLNCSISFKRFWQFKADETDIHGVIPDVKVPAAMALDKAIGLIKGK